MAAEIARIGNKLAATPDFVAPCFLTKVTELQFHTKCPLDLRG
jgi:hypothetical protein